MLHVILLILKIIGISFAILLGCVLMISILILFVPCRYQARVEKRETLTVQVKMHWLLHLISLPVSFQKQVFSAKLKLCGCTIKDLCAHEHNPKKTSAKKTKKIKKTKKRKQQTKAETDLKAPEPRKSISMAEPAVSVETAEQKSKKKKPFTRFLRKIRNLKYTIREFCGKIKKIIKKIRSAKEFVLDIHTKEALKLSLGQVLLLLKKIFPKNIRGEVRFGTEDPALTGEILAGISIFYPVFMDNVKVIPDFEQSCLEGELFLKGKLHAITLLRIAWKLFRDKNIRTVYQNLSG